MLRLNFEAAGYGVVTAHDGEDARAVALRLIPDLIVLDVTMPKMDGLEVLASLKGHASTRDIPVVMLTARASDSDVWDGWQAGADYYITKPFDLQELLRFVEYLQRNATESSTTS